MLPSYFDYVFGHLPVLYDKKHISGLNYGTPEILEMFIFIITRQTYRFGLEFNRLWVGARIRISFFRLNFKMSVRLRMKHSSSLFRNN